MQEVLGVSIHVPWTVELEGFIPRWKQQFHKDYRNITAAEMDYFGLWAYDAVFCLAMAVEKIGYISSELQKRCYLFLRLDRSSYLHGLSTWSRTFLCLIYQQIQRHCWRQWRIQDSKVR
ncbi:unnamed protein product [Prunus armeniaca]|uniref:Receptor ligand binding region domain-containing protein n=1 Tax=Prunus armeniaca TaxID=36596 RepID=A0A6J5W8F6_PRUAR|nr:unnamed protein product [Prunus armeniaca]